MRFDKLTVRRCNDDVRVRHKVESSASADAVHRADHRLRNLQVPWSELQAHLLELSAVSLHSALISHFQHVHSGTEGPAFSGMDNAANRPTCFKPLPSHGEFTA